MGWPGLGALGGSRSHEVLGCWAACRSLRFKETWLELGLEDLCRVEEATNLGTCRSLTPTDHLGLEKEIVAQLWGKGSGWPCAQ